MGEYFPRRFLSIFGGRRLVHGHTPISSLLRCPPAKVDSPWIYAGGQCVNVDGGMCLGGGGVLFQFTFSLCPFNKWLEKLRPTKSGSPSPRTLITFRPSHKGNRSRLLPQHP